ncbi:MAG: S41 family peptidase [Cyclobacteriaceae bacterium]
MKEYKNSKSAIRLPIFIGLAIAFGVLLGAQMADGTSGAKPELFKSLNKLKQVLTYIENDYVDEVDTDVLVEGVIEDMLQELDPHTVYISQEEKLLTQSQLQGNFEGIGIEFNIFKDTIMVVAPLSGGPSEKLGILSGDKIIKVDGETVAGVGFSNRDVVTRLRGEKGSKVVVSIKRGNQANLIDFEISRDVIPQYSVDVSYMVDDKTGYIKVSRFAATTYLEFKEALIRLNEQGMEKLVLDLTGNPGGYMDRAVDMVDEFLAGEQLIVFTQGKESRYNDSHYSRKDGDFENGSLVVMIDEGSASASEIVSGALQDHDRAMIVGRRSYGKGLVQLPISLNDGSELRLTISRYYTPSGRCIQKPYEDKDAYHREFVSRFENGEIFNEDSIQVNDSLVYKTDKGRLVYGGGGIVPDVFVPMDTVGNSRYLNRLFTSNTVAEFAFNYADRNRKKLEKMGLENYINDFELSEKDLKSLSTQAEKNGVAFEKEQFEKSKNQLALLVKAHIARGIWDNAGFYPVINQQNEIFLRALDLFGKADQLAKK